MAEEKDALGGNDSAPAAVETSGECTGAIDESVRRLLDSDDAVALRGALLKEATERRRAECLANIQTEITKYTLDLLVRVPNLDAFFHALLKTLAEEGESHAAGVWLINDEKQCCEFWMAHLYGEVFTAANVGPTLHPRLAMADLLFDYKAGWEQTIEYRSDDARLPQVVRDFNCEQGLFSTVAAPLLLGGKNLGWITLCAAETPEGTEPGGARHWSRPSPVMRRSPCTRAGSSNRSAPRSAAKPFSRSATASRATSTTISRRASAQS